MHVDQRTISGRAVVTVGAVFVLVLALVLSAYVALGAPGLGRGTRPSGGATAGMGRAALTRLGVDTFASRLADPRAVVVNVHTPYAGELPGTDLFIPYDRITGQGDLPSDRATPILLYCRSGRMSKIAGDALVASGYTNVMDLRGGMDAWEAAGRPVEWRAR